VVLLLDHHTGFVHSFLFHHLRRADAVDILHKPADLFAGPGNHVLHGARFGLLGFFHGVNGAQRRTGTGGAFSRSGCRKFCLIA